jgi:hypothetical protein
VRGELDADQPKLKASLEALNVKRVEALRDFWADGALAGILDGTSNTIRQAKPSAARDAAAARQAELARKVEALTQVNRDALARWNTSYSGAPAVLASVAPLHGQLGDLTQRLDDAVVPDQVKSVTQQLQGKLAALDSVTATAVATSQSQSAAWQPVFAASQELGRAMAGLEGSGGNFGSTPGLSGGDMVQRMAAMNVQFLALQEATQMESRKFQTLSNASKARHDIALNAIRNLK